MSGKNYKKTPWIPMSLTFTQKFLMCILELKGVGLGGESLKRCIILTLFHLLILEYWINRLHDILKSM